MLISIIIRTLNEDQYLEELLNSIENQVKKDFKHEVVIVDSGSTDKTLDIAKKFKARITFIDRNKFTFGRSLNIGCKFAKGEYLVFVSGHCIPVNKNWLSKLIKPLQDNKCDYVYGRQVGAESTKFSENQVFEKYFPKEPNTRINKIFCNNANSAIKKKIWSKYKFDEELTGLEDMYLAKQITQDNGKVGYAPKAIVYHIHNESWAQVKNRYERESIALQKIMPEVSVSLIDAIHFIIIGILKDVRLAIRKRVLLKELFSIFLFRFMQYYGVYKGNHSSRQMSQKTKMKYFYPRLKK